MKLQLAALIAGTFLTQAAHALEENALIADRTMNDRLRPKTSYYSGAYIPARQMTPIAVETTPAPKMEVKLQTAASTSPAVAAQAPRAAQVYPQVTKEPARPAAPKPAPEQVPATYTSNAKANDLLSRLDKMDERRQNVDSVIAHMKVVYKDSNTKREFGLNGIYLADKNGNLRVRLLFSETLIADLVFRGDTVEAWLPMKGKYLKGSRAELLGSGSNDLALLARVGSAREFFFPRAWVDGATERRGAVVNGIETVRVQANAGKDGQCVRKVQLASGQPYADAMSLYTGMGESLGELRYANYTDMNGTPLHPGTITLLPAKGTSSLKMTVDEFSLNQDLPEKSFEVIVPDEQKAENLMQCLKEGKGIF